MNSDYDQLTKQMDEIVQSLQDEIAKIRATRANTNAVEEVIIEQYGTKLPVKQLATISTPQTNLIQVSPWDKNTLGAIEKALQMADLGYQIVNDGQSVRATLPPMTGENREEFVRKVERLAEDAKIKLRQAREVEWEAVQTKVKNKELTEDDKYRAKDELDKAIREYNGKLDDIAMRKKDEILQ